MDKQHATKQGWHTGTPWGMLADFLEDHGFNLRGLRQKVALSGDGDGFGYGSGDGDGFGYGGGCGDGFGYGGGCGDGSGYGGGDGFGYGGGYGGGYGYG